MSAGIVVALVLGVFSAVLTALMNNAKRSIAGNRFDKKNTGRLGDEELLSLVSAYLVFAERLRRPACADATVGADLPEYNGTTWYTSFLQTCFNVYSGAGIELPIAVGREEDMEDSALFRIEADVERNRLVMRYNAKLNSNIHLVDAVVNKMFASVCLKLNGVSAVPLCEISAAADYLVAYLGMGAFLVSGVERRTTELSNGVQFSFRKISHVNPAEVAFACCLSGSLAGQGEVKVPGYVVGDIANKAFALATEEFSKMSAKKDDAGSERWQELEDLAKELRSKVAVLRVRSGSVEGSGNVHFREVEDISEFLRLRRGCMQSSVSGLKDVLAWRGRNFHRLLEKRLRKVRSPIEKLYRRAN